MPGLPDDLTLREATPADHDAIVAINGAVFGFREEAFVRHLLTDPGFGPGRWIVVVDRDGQVVSAMTLLVWTCRYEDVEFPLAQIEFVTTMPEWRRRGLVRAQVDVMHEWAAEAGCLVNMIQGIPHIYRGLGYGYGMTYAEELRLFRAPEAPAGIEVTDAVEADLPTLAALHTETQRSADTAVLWDDASWGWYYRGFRDWDADLVVARRDGEIVGYATYQRREDEDYAVLDDAVIADYAVGEALVADFIERAGDLPKWLCDRPATRWSTVAWTHAAPQPGRFHGVYARIPDPVAFLNHIRPVLSRRLAASPAAGESGEVVVSTYDDAVAFVVDQGEVVEVKQVEASFKPLDDDHPGCPPDQLPALLLGRFGAAELELRVDDVSLGIKERSVLEALFPKMVTDVCTPI